MAEFSDKSERSDVQIYVAKTDSQGFEVLEMLDARPGWSKLKLHIWTYAKGGGEDSGQEHGEYYVDTDDFKTIARAVMARFSPFVSDPTPEAPDRKLWEDHKGTPRQGAEPQARILELVHRPSRKYPFELTIKNGTGQVIGQGAVKMVKVETRLTFRFTQFDFVSLCGEVLDWVHDWEVRHHAARREARTVSRGG